MPDEFWIDGPTTAGILLIAMVADLALPSLWRFTNAPWHPATLLRRSIRELARRLDRRKRSEPTRAARGAVLLMILVGLAAAAGWVLQTLLHGQPFGWIGELALVFAMLGQGSVLGRAGAVARASDDPKRGAIETATAFGRDTGGQDSHRAARFAIEGIAVGLANRVTGTLFWFALLGLPGAIGYRMAEACSEALDRYDKESAFSLAIHRFADAAAALPTMLTAIAMSIATLAVPRANPLSALKTTGFGKPTGARLVDPWAMGAMAGGLGLSLGGPETWIGRGTAQAVATDVQRARYLFVVACLVIAIPVAVATALGR